MKKPLSYQIFEIALRSDGDQYIAHVMRSFAGETRSIFAPPLVGVEDDVEIPRHELRDRLLSLQLPRAKRAQHFSQVKQVGQQLFDALMSGEVRSCYDVSLNEARRNQQGLRVRLRIETPELADLPWELMFDKRTGTFPSLSIYTPIVRYLELQQWTRPFSVAHPLSILIVLASPADLPPVDVEGETERLMQALGGLIDAGAIRVTVVRQADLLTVQRLLREEEVHILHFTGHGLFDNEGYLVLENEQGVSQPISGQKLGRLLHDEETLQLVSLNACSTAVDSASEPFSGVATALVQAGIPAVVAMQTQITDQAALQFAQVFYESLAYGYPVDAAVAEGRKAIDLVGTHSVEWAIPMLFMRVSDGMLFNFESEIGEPELPEPLQPLFTLTVVEGPLAGESFDVYDSPVTIGRTEDNTIQIVDTKVSRRHVQFEWRDDALWVADLNSTNGTLLNNDRIEEARIIASGDWLKVGQATLALTFPGDEPMTPERFRKQQRKRRATDIDKTMKPVVASIRGKTAAPLQPIQPGERPPVPVPSRDFQSEMLMQRVPASSFKYGPDQTEVELYEFEIDAWPVTNADYFIYIQTTGAQPPATWPQGTYPRERATHPVTGVSWDEAAAYAAWAGKRLPTAIEWEKAARGTDGRLFPWGDTFDRDRCNTVENNFNSTTPVGQYQNGVSPYGVFDMAGNVWEWTADEVQARGLGVKKTKRIRKGGAYNARQDAAECATQSSAWPDDRADNVGFRCAR